MQQRGPERRRRLTWFSLVHSDQLQSERSRGQVLVDLSMAPGDCLRPACLCPAPGRAACRAAGGMGRGRGCLEPCTLGTWQQAAACRGVRYSSASCEARPAPGDRGCSIGQNFPVLSMCADWLYKGRDAMCSTAPQHALDNPTTSSTTVFHLSVCNSVAQAGPHYLSPS